MPVNILVTEDESIVRKDIERSLKKLGYNVIGTADTGEKAIALARDLKPDLALMDIMLKGNMTGIEAAEAIRKEVDIPIVFLTAHSDESTLKSAKMTEPHGYILKPFKEIDIHTTVEMAIHKHQKESEVKLENELLRKLAMPKENADLIFVKSKSRLIRLRTEDIICVEALKDYVVIHTATDKYTIHATMKDIERKLPNTHFQRIHRSYIVNVDKIAAIHNSSNVVLEGKEGEYPIGGSYRDAISDRINLL
jgi:DNA-binding LytR/AlgR family response regulator